jgi:glycosyltransferase involved in cell wall biosynthesis
MKILQMISSGGMYGAEAVVLNLSRTLNEGLHRSPLGVFSNSSNPNLQLHENAAKEGIESSLIPCDGQIDRKAITNIRELVQRTGVDVVHAHGYKADIYAFLALRTSGVSLVSTCHNWIDSDQKLSFYGTLDRLILRGYAQVVAVSDEVRQRLLKSGVKVNKVSMIRNGIDLRPFDCASAVVRHELGWDAEQIVGFVGRLSREKGADIFLDAAARVLAQCPDTKFVVAGDGPDRAELDALIDKLGIRDSVRMLGRCDDMPGVYASLDIMVSASRTEGLPIAILEGMASRLPLVATAVGDVPTVIQDGHTGVLAPAEDPASLAAAIVELLRDAAKRKQLGSAARELVENEFSAERMAADYLRVYEDAIAATAKGRERHVAPSVASRGGRG